MAKNEIDLYVWGFVEGLTKPGTAIALTVTLPECQEMLDEYSLDKIQLFIIGGQLQGALLRDLAPYLRSRMTEWLL